MSWIIPLLIAVVIIIIAIVARFRSSFTSTATPAITATTKKSGWIMALWWIMALIVGILILGTLISGQRQEVITNEDFFGEYSVDPSVPRNFGQYLPPGQYRVEPWMRGLFIRFSTSPGKWIDRKVESPGTFSVNADDNACAIGGRAGIFKLYRKEG